MLCAGLFPPVEKLYLLLALCCAVNGCGTWQAVGTVGGSATRTRARAAENRRSAGTTNPTRAETAICSDLIFCSPRPIALIGKMTREIIPSRQALLVSPSPGRAPLMHASTFECSSARVARATARAGGKSYRGHGQPPGSVLICSLECSLRFNNCGAGHKFCRRATTPLARVRSPVLYIRLLVL